jgi:hypothetical protein
MKCNLSKMLVFLEENHKYNRSVQLASIRSSLLPFDSNKSKIKSLMMDVGQTQFRQKLDSASDLWKAIDITDHDFDSVLDLVNFLTVLSGLETSDLSNKSIAEDLFMCLINTSGFGPKTAALFVKDLAMIHMVDNKIGYSEENLSFLKDGDKLTDGNPKIFLPVDSVIQHVFTHNFCNLEAKPSNAFYLINKHLIDFMEANDVPLSKMIYWDDLWYWGFITQRGSGDKRKTEFNEGKYRSLKTSTQKEFSEVKVAADKFIQILG